MTGSSPLISSDPQFSDAQEVRRSLRDIVALSTLPAMWSGAEPLRIAESLAASLFTTLEAEFVYICFSDGAGRPPIEVAQTERYHTNPSLAKETGQALLDWARTHDPDELLLLPNPLGSGTLRVTARPIGPCAELGVIAAAFADPTAPTPAQHLILNVGASQAASAISNAHLLRSLRESEERFRSLVGVITDVSWTTDGQGAFVTFQPKWAEYTGQTWEEFRGFGWINALHPDDRDQVRQIWEEALATRTVYEAHGRIWHAPSQQYRYFVARAAPLFNPNGSVREWVGAYTDVHERKQAEEASARLAAIITSSSDAIASKTLEGIITSWNASAERMFGYTAQEMIGQPVLRLIPPHLHQEEDHILARLKAGERIEHYETVRVTKDGRNLNVSLSISPIKDSTGHIIGAAKIVRDITERKRAEEALRESEQHLSALINQTISAIAETDLTGCYRFVNDRYCELTGYTREELIGKMWMQEITHPEDLPRNTQDFQRLVEEGVPFTIEKRYLRKDGSIVWVANSVSAITDNKGKPQSAVAVIVDITERKQAEVTERLLAEMRERNRLAQELHDTVAQALGYLNLKIGMTHSLVAGNQVDTAKAYLQELKQVISETYTDVREEIYYLRAKALSDLSFMELLERYVDKYHRFYNLDIQLLKETEPTAFDFPPEVTSQLIRTIQEALINIRKHAKVNSAVIRLSRENGTFRISIEDEGQGFDPAQSQAKPSSFGLQIMRERVESVGGRLEVNTVPGQGTRIVLYYSQ